MSVQTTKITVTLPEGEVFADMSFVAPEGATFNISTPNETLSERSPLHPQAINMDDLRPGMYIQRHNINEGSFRQPIWCIIGDPYRRGTKYPRDRYADLWMIDLGHINSTGELVVLYHFLSDMGIVPYEEDDGTRSWSCHNYTLALD